VLLALLACRVLLAFRVPVVLKAQPVFRVRLAQMVLRVLLAYKVRAVLKGQLV
jgi:hypothetical protein